MSRTKGSKNNPKKSLNVSVIKLNKNINGTAEINDTTPFGWVNWGLRNDYPNMLLELYFNSITHHSCVDFLVNAIIGEGIDYEAMKLNGSDVFPNQNETWDDLIRKVSFDFILYGGFSVQVIKNKDDKSYSFYHMPISSIRVGKKDDDGNIKKAYISKDFTNTTKYKPIEVDVLSSLNTEGITKGKQYLYLYYSYNPFDEYYSYPNYIGAIDAIRAEIKMKRYDYSSIVNNFTPSGIITLNQVANDEEKQLIINNIDAMFSDSENANNVIVTFKNSAEDQPVTFTPITAPTEGVNLFADNNDRTIDRIIAAHKIANKGLIGLPMDASGFSNEGTLLEAAYNLTNKIHVKNLRNTITRNINQMFKMNGIDTEIILKPISFNITDVTNISEKDDQINKDVTDNITNN